MSWSFDVRPSSIGLDASLRFDGSKLVHHTTLRITGIVIRGEALIEGTTVYGSVYTRDDEIVRKSQENGILGAASVSKDVKNVRTISSADPLQIGGIDIWIPLLRVQFRELLAELSLVDDASRMILEFGCVGTALAERSLARPELVLGNENVKLSIVEFRVNFLLQRLTDAETRALRAAHGDNA